MSPPIYLQQNAVYGFLELTDSEYAPQTLDAANYSASACGRCGATDLLIRSHYRWENELVHLRRYIVCCESCHRVGPERLNAISAVRAWDRSNKQWTGDRDVAPKQNASKPEGGRFSGPLRLRIGGEQKASSEEGEGGKPADP